MFFLPFLCKSFPCRRGPDRQICVRGEKERPIARLGLSDVIRFMTMMYQRGVQLQNRADDKAHLKANPGVDKCTLAHPSKKPKGDVQGDSSCRTPQLS